MNTIRLKKDIRADGVVYLRAGKEYPVRDEEPSENPGKIKVVVQSEVKKIDLIIEVDKES